MDKDAESFNTNHGNRLITAKQAAEILEISYASIRNWTRYGYLQPIDMAKRSFLLTDVLNLKKKIADGNIRRLRKRANKVSADRMFAPVEYIEADGNQTLILALIDYLISRQVERSVAVFLLALNLFCSTEEIYCRDLQRILQFPREIFRRSAVYQELYAYYADIPAYIFHEKQDDEVYDYLFNLPLPTGCEVLGIVYQALTHEGEKARSGSYFTPVEIVKDAVQGNIQKGQRVLDPCCGTGQFLLAFARTIDNPENIWGMDLDLNAVRIARLNLLLYYARDFRPNIFHCDTLKHYALQQAVDEPAAHYDFIATNPPWGADIDGDIVRQLAVVFPEITSGESFSYFLRGSIALLKDGGTASFILPESLLNVRLHSDIREYILKNCRINKIEYLGRRFQHVFSSVIRIDIQKSTPLYDDENAADVLVRFPDKEYRISQKRFLNNPGFVIDIFLSLQDEVILRKVYTAAHTTLKNQADWALGIVTGDNQRHLCKTMVPKMEPVYKGSDVKRFTLKAPTTYIRFTPQDYQQVAPVYKYRAKEKLIYRFISSQLIFAYDNTGCLTLNSANILIPKIENYPVKVILALFNSSLYQFIFARKYHTLKILRGDLERLPLPLWTEAVFSHIVGLADKMINGSDHYAELDDYIMAQFGLTSEESDYIKTNLT